MKTLLGITGMLPKNCSMKKKLSPSRREFFTEASPFPLWQDIVFSLILGLSPSEAFASLYYKMFFWSISKKNRSNTISCHLLLFIDSWFNLIMKKEMRTVSNTGMDYLHGIITYGFA